MPLKKTKFNALRINLKKCEVFLGVVKKNNDRSNRVYVPPEWQDGRKVYVVLKDE